MRRALAAFVAILLLAGAPDARGTGLDALVDAAAAYVRDYQQQLTAIIADETYTQQLRAQTPLDKGMARTRTLISEIFFMFTPGHDWMAIRDVMSMDGRPVSDRPDLRSALQSLAAHDVARRFKAYNSRYNLGRIVRNFNEPTLSLLVLDDAHRSRFRFERSRTQRQGGEELVTLSFRETRGPTLVRQLNGGPAYARGEVTIEPSTGRVTRAVLALVIDPVKLTLTTTYAPDARLGIWVPARFGEWYEHGRAPRKDARTLPSGDAHEEIVCEAKYSNFRRFEVKASIR
ncbi:MAG: hypothetical protein WD690_06660 [Vicinamibacterales bacterium]